MRGSLERRSVRVVALAWVVGGVLVGAGMAEADDGEPSVKLDPVMLTGPGASAAEAFAAGDYAEAARRYQVLMDTGGVSADMLYNLGTAWAWADEPGRATWALERARLLAPRDEGILHNLEVVRSRTKLERMEAASGRKLTEGDPEGFFWFHMSTSVRPEELGLMTVLFNILAFAAVALWRRMSPGAKRDGVAVVAVMLLVGAGLGMSAAVGQALARERVELGAILEDGIGLSQTPTTTSERAAHADIYNGAMVRVLERRTDGWSQIKVVDQSVGWVRSDQIGLVR